MKILNWILDEVFPELGDWLYARRRDKENMEQIEQLDKLRDSLNLPEAKRSANGLIVCPNCDYEFSFFEMIEQESMEQQPVPGLGIYQCPQCHETFKMN